MSYIPFNKILTSTEKERDELHAECISLYKAAREDETNTLAEYRKDEKNTRAKGIYFQSVQRIGGIMEVLDILNIKYAQDIGDELLF